MKKVKEREGEMVTLAGVVIGEDEIGVLADIEFLVVDDFGFEIANGDRRQASNVDGVEVGRASEFEPNGHG